MPIQIPSFFVPRNANAFYLLEDKYLKGGFQIWADINARDSIPAGNRKAGMLVYTQADQKLWTLSTDLTTWEESGLGGTGGAVRNIALYTTPELEPNEFHDFALVLGKTCVVNRLVMSVPMLLQIYGTPDRTAENPFEFLATPDHLYDDGTTLMSDGSVFKNRRFSILSNEEDPPAPNAYARITNTGQIPSSTTISITYVTLE